MRKAASMIELVIAIVVMGIAMMTLPMMLTTTQSNNAFAMQQEGILAARTKLGDILTYRWDRKSESPDGMIKVLDTNSKSSDINYSRIDINSTRRIGHVKGNLRRKLFNTETSASTIFNPGPPYNAIEDFNGTDFNDTSVVIDGNTNRSKDYRFIDTNLSITVKYIDDNSTRNTTFDFNQTSSPTGTTNIKMIEVNTTTTDATSPDKNISFILRAFSCNIGANEILRRPY